MYKTTLFQMNSHIFVVVLVLSICSPHELNILTWNSWSTFIVLDVSAIWYHTYTTIWQILKNEDIDSMDIRKNLHTHAFTQPNTQIHDSHTWYRCASTTNLKLDVDMIRYNIDTEEICESWIENGDKKNCMDNYIGAHTT